MSNPREGTILSVIAVFASSLREQTNNNREIAFAELLSQALSMLASYDPS